MKKNLLLALSSLAISAFIHQAHAQTTPTTLHVSVTGNDSTGTGSSSAPYRTLRKAAQKSVLGGKIYLQPGIYNVGANSGSLNKWHYEIELNTTEAGKLTTTPTFCDGYDPAKMLTVTVDPAIAGSVIFRMDSSYSSGSHGTQLLGIRSGCVAFDGNNRTLIDGNNVPVNSTSGILFMNGLRNIIFKNSELQWSTLPLSNRVANSSNTRPVYVSGTGISFSGMTNLKIQNNKIHHFDGSSIYGHGNNVLIENNDIHHVVLENANNWYIKTLLSDGGWAGTLNIVPEWVNGTRAQSSNIVIRNNLVHESWGEGIIAGFIGGEVSGNTVYDTYANGIYLNGSKDIAVLRNYIYTTNNTYDKCYGSTYPTTSLRNTCLHLYAFSIAMEYSSTTPSITAENLTIDNNLAVRVERGINYWKDPANLNANNTYRNLKIRHNTFVDVREKSAVIYELCSPACSTLWSGNEFKNNLFIHAPRTPALTQLNFPNDELWSISNNLVSTSISDAGFAGPTLTPGAAVANFALATTAPVGVARGGVVSSQNADYFGKLRNASYPSLGMHESSSTALPPPPPPPVVLGPNLLNNGGFEAGNFSSWSNVVAGIYPDSADHTTNSVYAAHFTVSNIEIAQGFLPVTARANYVLSASFKCKALSGTGSGFPRLMVYGKEPGGTTWRVVATSDQATMLAYCGGSKVGTWQSVKVPFVAQWRDSASGITYDINQILVRAGSVNTKQTTDFLFDDVSLNLRY